MRRRRRLLYGALAALYLLHTDLWLWDQPAAIAGLPAGLAYHLAYCLAAAALMAALVAWAWPRDLDLPAAPPDRAPGGPPSPEGHRPAPRRAAGPEPRTGPPAPRGARPDSGRTGAP